MGTDFIRGLEQKVHRFIAEKALIGKGDVVLVAFSGGADSVFLLHFLHKFVKRYKIRVVAAHFNHKLRAEADEDEEFCRRFAEKLNIEFIAQSGEVASYAGSRKISIEMAARELRYVFFESCAVKFNAAKVATGHHSDDNTETILMNFIRGTGIRGIAGIPVSNGKIIRPLLAISKDEIVHYLQAAGVSFVTDKSNFSDDIPRNYIRNVVLPGIKQHLNPGIADTLNRNTEYFSELAEFVESQAEEIAKKYVTVTENQTLVAGEISAEPKVLTATVFHNVLTGLIGADKTHYKVINAVIRLLGSERGKKLTLSDVTEAERTDKGVYIRPKSEKRGFHSEFGTGESSVLNFRINFTRVETAGTSRSSYPLTEYISLPENEPHLVIRSRKPGDAYKPIGMTGSKSVSDILNELKLSAQEKENTPVIEYNGSVILIPGYRIAESVKVTHGSEFIFELKLDKDE